MLAAYLTGPGRSGVANGSLQQTAARADGPTRALKCGDGDRCTRLRARRAHSLRSQAIRDELVEREKGEKQKAVAKDELHAKHGALSRFAK